MNRAPFTSKGIVYVRGRDDLAILASGTTGPTYTFQKPCPATPGRVQQFKSFTGEEVPDVPTSDKVPLGALSQLKVSVAAVEEEDGTLARSLSEMIEDKSWANDLIIGLKQDARASPRGEPVWVPVRASPRPCRASVL